MPLLDEDRLFPVGTHGKGLARELFRNLCDLPIISPHGHTDPGWFAKNAQFNNPAGCCQTNENSHRIASAA